MSAATSHRRRLTRADQAILSKQTYAPARLIKYPRRLHAYLLLHDEFGSGEWVAPMLEIAATLGVTERGARDQIAALRDAGALQVEQRPGKKSKYRLVQGDRYIEMPRGIPVRGSHAVCAVWGALRIGLGPGRSALTCETAVVKMSWAKIQAITGLCRTAVGKALRWLRKHGWLSRRVVWASIDPILRAVCKWKLRMRTPEEKRTPPRQESVQPRSGGSRNRVKPPAGLSISPGVGERAANAVRKAGVEGVEALAAWRSLTQQSR